MRNEFECVCEKSAEFLSELAEIIYTYIHFYKMVLAGIDSAALYSQTIVHTLLLSEIQQYKASELISKHQSIWWVFQIPSTL